MVTTAYDQKLVLQEKKNFFKLKVGSKLEKKTENT